MKLVWNYIYLEKDNRFGEDKVIFYKKIVKKTLSYNKDYKVGDKVFLKTKIIVDPINLYKEKCFVVGIVKKIVDNVVVIDLENI